MAGQQQEIKSLGGDKYDWIYGDMHMPIVADGREHSTKFGGTYSVKQEAPDKWVMTRMHHGHVTAVHTWTLSDGGQQWNIKTKGTHPDGSSFTENETKTRVGAGSGFAGTWESKHDQLSSFPNWVIGTYGQNGLSFRTPADQEYQNVKFDGKEYPDHGPRVPPGATSSAKRIDEHTIQVTDDLKGKVLDTQELKVSGDGKTLTDTEHVSGEQTPQIIVFEKM
ncbi:MAG: hypothetical protein ACRD4O_19485 [Bryobacteraceae bacterium]